MTKGAVHLTFNILSWWLKYQINQQFSHVQFYTAVSLDMVEFSNSNQKFTPNSLERMILLLW